MMHAYARKGLAPFVGTPSARPLDSSATRVLRNEDSDVSLIALTALRSRLSNLEQLPPNWDGYGSEKPNVAAVNSARGSLTGLFRAAALTDYGWSDPHVSANESGDVVLEWWQGAKKITLYVTPTEARFVLVWGEDMDTEMDEGPLSTRFDFKRIWDWLHS
jgi:hypothetical protein